ncbi:hypothetical protein ACQPZF_10710 [Actinosynnema sp. CS-041913]|uniref:hypothetical protein n=1 Tax=Actinosynnema sp. CS-041913 TaxID=3239917 RepID=UPI003D8C6A6C
MTRSKRVEALLVLGGLRAAEHALRPVLDTPAFRVSPLVHSVTEVGALATRVGGRADPTARKIRGAVTDSGGDTVMRELTT